MGAFVMLAGTDDHLTRDSKFGKYEFDHLESEILVETEGSESDQPTIQRSYEPGVR